MKDVVADLCERMELLRLRHNIVFDPEGSVKALAAPPYIPMALALTAGLRENDPTAVKIVRSLIDPADMDRSEFWGTPLGRLLFAAGGYRNETINQAAAAQVLGCSRAWTQQLAKRSGSTYLPVSEVRQLLSDRLYRLVK